MVLCIELLTYIGKNLSDFCYLLISTPYSSVSLCLIYSPVLRDLILLKLRSKGFSLPTRKSQPEFFGLPFTKICNLASTHLSRFIAHMSLQVEQMLIKRQALWKETKTTARSLTWGEGEKYKQNILISKCAERAALETRTWCSEAQKEPPGGNYHPVLTYIILLSFLRMSCISTNWPFVISVRNALPPITFLADFYSFLSIG